MMKCYVTFVVLLSALLLLGGDEERLAFSTREGVDHATMVLKSRGIGTFMDCVWCQQLAAPPIHSRYWLDRYCDEGQEDGRLEKARRDFGYELAIQIDRLAVEVHEKPLGAGELKRINWLLRLSRWILEPKRFENFRLAARTEEIATMSLVRIVADPNVSNEDIETLFTRFMGVRESAMARADILYEESQGIFDVRRAAKKGVDDGCFERAWLPARNRAVGKAEGKGIRFTAGRSEKLKALNGDVAFFIDDTPHVPRSISENWDLQLFKFTCVYRVQALELASIRKFYSFRKTLGKIPELKLEYWEDPEDSYREYFEKQLTLSNLDERNLYLASYAAHYVSCVKNNSYMDGETREIVAARERRRISLLSPEERERENLRSRKEEEERQRIWEVRQVKLRERREEMLRNREKLMLELRKKWKAEAEARRAKKKE